MRGSEAGEDDDPRVVAHFEASLTVPEPRGSDKAAKLQRALNQLQVAHLIRTIRPKVIKNSTKRTNYTKINKNLLQPGLLTARNPGSRQTTPEAGREVQQGQPQARPGGKAPLPGRGRERGERGGGEGPQAQPPARETREAHQPPKGEDSEETKVQLNESSNICKSNSKCDTKRNILVHFKTTEILTHSQPIASWYKNDIMGECSRLPKLTKNKVASKLSTVVSRAKTKSKCVPSPVKYNSLINGIPSIFHKNAYHISRESPHKTLKRSTANPLRLSEEEPELFFSHLVS